MEKDADKMCTTEMEKDADKMCTTGWGSWVACFSFGRWVVGRFCLCVIFVGETYKHKIILIMGKVG
jgi:hypothetical protein